MQSDADEEYIEQLRKAALLTKPNNMRKRKVTLTSTRKIISSEGDRREVVQATTRQVYVGGGNSTPSLPDSNVVSISTEETTDILGRKRISETLLDTHLQADGEECPKKPRHDQRIVDVFEEKESVSEENLVEKEMVTLKGHNDRDSKLKDVRIIVSKNGKTEAEIHEEEMETPEKNDGELEEDLLEDGDVVNTDNEEVHSLESGSYNNDIDDNDIVQKQTEDHVENKPEDDNDDEKVILDDSVENTARNVEVKDDGGNESEKLNETKNEQTNNEDKKDISKKYTKNGATDKVMGKTSNNVTETKSEEKPIVVKSEEKRQDTSLKTSDVRDVDESKRSESDDSSGDESGSESDSSDSSSSSSGSSSSSRSSSSSSSSSSSGGSSRSGSGTGSASDSENDKKSGSRSRSRSVSSSSYSYSTGGSTEKKDTLRSVVAQTTQSSKPQQRRPSRSPRSRSRDRRYSRRPRSYERDDHYTDARDRRRDRDGERSNFSRRRSPYRERARQRSRSPPSFYRRGSRDRSRDRDRTGSSGRRYEKPQEEHVGRRRRQSRSPIRNDRQSSDNVEPKNPLLRKDDDFVDIDVSNNSSRAHESEKKSHIDKGFDLRSRLGSRKTDDAPNKEEEKRPVRVTIARRSIAYQDGNTNGKSDKELKLDARIERIRIKNEEIRKRKEEIEREKLFYG